MREFPYAVAATGDGERILVTNQHDDSVSVIDGGPTRPCVLQVGDYPEG